MTNGQEPERLLYDEDVGGKISLAGKLALGEVVKEVRLAGRRGRQGAVVDVLVKIAAEDAALVARIAERLPPGPKRTRRS